MIGSFLVYPTHKGGPEALAARILIAYDLACFEEFCIRAWWRQLAEYV